MIKTVLFGAGQTGAMLCRLLSGEHEILCFADNSGRRQGGRLLGLPILSPEESLLLNPQRVVLCVTDGQRGGEMEAQLRALHYNGEILRPDALRLFDARAAVMRLLAEQLSAEGIPGDAAELGVFRGEFAAMINAALPHRTLHLYDSFEGFSEEDAATDRQNRYSGAAAGDFSDTSVELVRQRLPHPEMARFHVGWFPDSFDRQADMCFALVSIDADLYAPTAAALPLFFDRLSTGGVLMVHDVNAGRFGGAAQAVKEFCRDRHIMPMPVCDLHGSVVIRK